MKSWRKSGRSSLRSLLQPLALEAGDYDTAARLFEETTYSAYNYMDLALLEEAFRYGQLTHLMANHKGVYPPLASAIACRAASRAADIAPASRAETCLGSKDEFGADMAARVCQICEYLTRRRPSAATSRWARR